MAITASLIAQLRAQSGAGMLDCKQALEATNGDISQAVDWLRKKGIMKAAKRADKVAAEGTVASYIHAGGKIGVLVEVNCETDFVAKTDAFKALVNDIAMHIVAAAPKYVSRTEVTASEMEREKQVYREQLANEGKTPEMAEKILEGKMSRYYSEFCLLDQPFVKDESKTMEQLLVEKTAETGEKISVRRFVRFVLGEGIEKIQTDFAAEVAAAVEMK